jgi:type IV pilus assembly protein PilA
MLQTLRNRAQDERGFTLIELLVVILIIGILAAIAIPSFISQKDKAGDASAKSYARNLQTADETYFTDNNAYAANLAALQALEPALTNLPGSVAPTASPAPAGGYTVIATSKAGVAYQIQRSPTGSISRTCTPVSKGGCNAAGTW